MSLGSILGGVTYILQKAADEGLANGTLTQAEHDALTGSLLSPAMSEINATLNDAAEKLSIGVEDIMTPLLDSLSTSTEPAQAEAASPASDPALEAKLADATETLRALAEQNPQLLDDVLQQMAEHKAEAAEPEPSESSGGLTGAISGVASTLIEAGGPLEAIANGGLLEGLQPVLDQVAEILPTSTSISDIIDIDVAEGEIDEVVVEARSDREVEIGELERLQNQANQAMTQAQAMAAQLTDDTEGDTDNNQDGSSDDSEPDTDDDAPEPADDADEPEPEAEPDPSELTE